MEIDLFPIGTSGPSTPPQMRSIFDGEPPAKRACIDAPFAFDFAGTSSSNICVITPLVAANPLPQPAPPVTPAPEFDVDAALPEAFDTSTLSKISTDPRSLTALATVAHMAMAPLPEAKRLYERLLDALEAMPHFDNWDLAFGNLLALRPTLMSRTADAMVALLVDAPGKQRINETTALVRAASNARFDTVLQSRLDAIAELPPAKRLAAWRDTLASCQRSDAYYDTARANRLAKCIDHLPEGEQRGAISTLLTNGGRAISGTDWEPLVHTCTIQAHRLALANLQTSAQPAPAGAQRAPVTPATVQLEVLKAAIDASTKAGDPAIKDTIGEVMRHLDRCPPETAQALLTIAVQITNAQDDYEHLGFSDLEAISVLRNLRDASGNDKRTYPRPDFERLIREQCDYAAE